eukprot:3935432-Rhodomonas_salina.1
METIRKRDSGMPECRCARSAVDCSRYATCVTSVYSHKMKSKSSLSSSRRNSTSRTHANRKTTPQDRSSA